MTITPITTGAFEEVCYLASNSEKEVIIIDPGADADVIADKLKAKKLRVVAYLLTHAHADHISALAELHDLYPAPIAIHSKDLSWAYNSVNKLEPYYPVPKEPKSPKYRHLETAKDWKFGGLEFTCIETPGHTPGSCCLLFKDADKIHLLAGDTLFKGSCGRTDLNGGDARALNKSLQSLKKLEAKTRVYPGHGPSTTIGIECATNFHMR